MPVIFAGLAAAVAKQPGQTPTINLSAPSAPLSLQIVAFGQSAKMPVLSPALSQDCFVRFSGGQDDHKAAKRKAESAYTYYQTLPQTEEAFLQKMLQLFRAERQRLGKSLPQKQKIQMAERYSDHIINQWINVEELYDEAINGKGHPESIRPADLAPPILPGISAKLVNQIRTNRIHRGNRGVQSMQGQRHPSPATPDEAEFPQRYMLGE